MVNVYITGEIEDSTVQAVHSALASNSRTIDIFINTVGGDAETSFAIYDLIANDPRVATHIIGKAYSGGSIIFFGGSRARTSLPHSRLMIHKGWAQASGNSYEMTYRADYLESVDAAQAGIFSKHLPKKLIKRFNAGEDVYLNTLEMQELGVLK